MQWLAYKVAKGIPMRLLEPRHAQELFALTHKYRRELRTWLPWLDATQSVQDTMRYIQAGLGLYANSRGLNAGIWVEGKVAGCISFNRISWAKRTTSIDYWLAPRYTEKGIITKCCRAMINHAIYELKLNRVEILCAMKTIKAAKSHNDLVFHTKVASDRLDGYTITSSITKCIL